MKQLTPLLLALLLCACSEPEHVSPAKFKSEYEWVGKAQSVKKDEYLGQREGRVFLRVGSLSPITGKWSDHVLYVRLDELEPAFRDSLPKIERTDMR